MIRSSSSPTPHPPIPHPIHLHPQTSQPKKREQFCLFLFIENNFRLFGWLYCLFVWVFDFIIVCVFFGFYVHLSCVCLCVYFYILCFSRVCLFVCLFETILLNFFVGNMFTNFFVVNSHLLPLSNIGTNEQFGNNERTV